MSDIKFNCPQCGQHLAVDSTGAGTTVACPKCGQAIIVPHLARTAKAEKPAQAKWWLWSLLGVTAVAVAAAAVWFQFFRQPGAIKPQSETKASGNVASMQMSSSDQNASALKEKWNKALTDARHNLQSSNDRESAELIGKILDSLDQPGGLSPTALENDRERMNKQVRELARIGALESAAVLQEMLYHLSDLHGNRTGPANPNHKTGGAPGPGGLVLYLPFDKPDDKGVIHDESGAGNDGRVSGAQWVSDGKFGGAYSFHITNLTDRIVIPNSDTLTTSQCQPGSRRRIGTDFGTGSWTRIGAAPIAWISAGIGMARERGANCRLNLARVTWDPTGR
jgi:predicted RNA-binding Zn-ribbon protein involved in translation (DUF1610 family)